MSPLRCRYRGFSILRRCLILGVALGVTGLATITAWGQAKPKPAPAKPDAEAPDLPADDLPDEPAAETTAKPQEKAPADIPEPKPGPKTTPAAEEPPTEAQVVELEVDESLSKRRLDIFRLIKSDSLNNDQAQQVKDYLEKYALARWTLKSERANVKKHRDELLNVLKLAKGEAHDQTAAMALAFLQKIAEGNHHAVARVNAMLAIGELNDVEAPRPMDPPTPMAAARPILRDTVADTELPDAVRVAAMVGIRRHAQLKAIPQEELNATVQMLLNLATAAPTPGRSPAGHAWLRCLAIESLAELGTAGQNGAVANTVLSVLADANAPLSVRSAAARALGRLSYPAEFPATAVMIRAMGQLTVDAAGDEIQRFESNGRKEFLRRRAQTNIVGAYNGLTGIAALASQPPESDLHGQVLQAITDVLKTLEDQSLEGEELIDELNEKLPQVSQAMAAAPPASKPGT